MQNTKPVEDIIGDVRWRGEHSQSGDLGRVSRWQALVQSSRMPDNDRPLAPATSASKIAAQGVTSSKGMFGAEADESIFRLAWITSKRFKFRGQASGAHQHQTSTSSHCCGMRCCGLLTISRSCSPIGAVCWQYRCPLFSTLATRTRKALYASDAGVALLSGV